MATPYPWAVVLMRDGHAYNFGTNPATGRRFVGYQQVGREDQDVLGDYNQHAFVHWAESEAAADSILSTLIDRFPHNSYAKMQTREVAMVSKAPPQRAIYTEEGLIPA
jgi:hypothetical protein